MRYLIYLRVSTDQQDMETQLRMCTERIQQFHPQGGSAYEVFADPDMSSGVALAKRVELQRLLGSVKKGDTVLVYKLDRLSRDIIEMVTIYRQIVNKCGARVISLNDPYSDEFSVGLMGLLAQKEREVLRTRIKDKLTTKAKKGERYSRHLPYGYGIHATHKVPIKVGKETHYKPGVLIPVEDEQAVLARMKEFFEQGMSYGNIAQALTLSGYRNRAGNPFQKMTVYRILTRTGHTRSSDQPLDEKESIRSH